MGQPVIVQSLFDTNLTQLRRSSVEQEKKSHKRFYKNRRFSGSSFSGILVRFSIKIGDFGFDFHKISLSGIVGPTETSLMLWSYGNGFIKEATLFGS